MPDMGWVIPCAKNLDMASRHFKRMIMSGNDNGRCLKEEIMKSGMSAGEKRAAVFWVDQMVEESRS